MLKWTDKKNGIDDVLAEDINNIAHAVMGLEENANKNVVDQTYSPDSENAQSGKAVAEAVATEQKRSDNTFANALKGSASGSTVVAIKDVSPLPHDVTVKVSGGDTAVKVYGKNLFKPTSARQHGGEAIDKFSVQEDGSIKIVGGAGVSINYALNPNPTLPAGTYTFKGTNTDKFMYYVFTLKNGVQTSWLDGTFTLNEGDTIQYLQVRSNRNYTGAYDDVINVQIEAGSVATDYEPYREPVTYAVSGGEVTVPSQYPSMTFIPETEGVTLSVEYNRDINKAFAELQAAIISLGGNI